MDLGIEAEFLAKQIELEKDMLFLSAKTVMFRIKDNVNYQVFFQWNENKKLQGQLLSFNDTVCLKVFNKNKQIDNLQGQVQQINNSVIIIELDSQPKEICLQNILYDDQQDYQSNINQFRSNTLEIYFTSHVVYTSANEISYDLTRTSDIYLKELMKKATSNITKSDLPNILALNGKDFHENLELASQQIPNRKRITKIIEQVKETLTVQKNYFPNEFQIKAIKQALGSSISLIQGCPGGSKTYTSAVIAACLLKLYPQQKLLCCAGSNTASDNLTLYCRKLNLNVIRVYARSKEAVEDISIPKEVQDVSLHNIIKNKVQNRIYLQEGLVSVYQNDELFNYSPLQQSKNFNECGNWYKELEQYELKQSNIIVATCVSSNLSKFKQIQFSALILDESSQILETESIIPISFVPNHFILVGDQKQLGPTIINKDSERSNYGRSLYQRLFELGLKPIQLLQQYRMHPGLLEFSNQHFYDKVIKSEVSSEQRSLVPVIKKGLKQKLQPDFPSFFWHVKGQENRHAKSFKNQEEVNAVVTLIYSIMNEYEIKQEQIGVITPYSGQQFLIQSQLKKLPLVEVNSVDGFQGREKDVIIFSTVRSNNTDTIGFLHQKNRVNVAFTRARNMFFIIGDYTQLNEKPGIWRDVVEFYLKKGALFQGDTLKNLTQVE